MNVIFEDGKKHIVNVLNRGRAAALHKYGIIEYAICFYPTP